MVRWLVVCSWKSNRRCLILLVLLLMFWLLCFLSFCLSSVSHESLGVVCYLCHVVKWGLHKSEQKILCFWLGWTHACCFAFFSREWCLLSTSWLTRLVVCNSIQQQFSFHSLPAEKEEKFTYSRDGLLHCGQRSCKDVLYFLLEIHSLVMRPRGGDVNEVESFSFCTIQILVE